VFIAAVLVAALLSFIMPNEYESEALYRLRTPPSIEGVQIRMPSLQSSMILLTSEDLLMKTVKELKLTERKEFANTSELGVVRWLKGSIKIENLKDTDFLRIKLRAALTPELLQQILEKHLSIFGEKLKEDLVKDINESVGLIKRTEEVFTKQKEALITEADNIIRERKGVLERQRNETLKAIAEITSRQQSLKLQVGEQLAVLEGIILRRMFEALNDQLHAIEADLNRLEAKGLEELPGLNVRVQAIDQQLENLRITAEKAKGLLNPGWEPFEIVSTPFAPEAPIGTNKRQNILIGGVLGLFLGVLLAFFVHYMQGGKEQLASLQVSKPQVSKET